MKKTRGLTRRDFMKTMAVLGAAASTSGLLQSCGRSSQQTESKTLFFNNSNLDPDEHDFYVAVGDRNYKLQRITPEKLRSAKESNSFLKAIPSTSITHYFEGLQFAADDIQLCYVKKVPKNADSDTLWKTASMFFNIPRSSMENAFMDRQKSAGLSLKRKFYGLTNKAGSAKELFEEDVLIDPTDTATSIVFTFPEILSFDSDSAAYVRLNIIDQEPATYMLSQIIAQQGPKWAVNVVLKDDDGKPYRDPEGKIVQIIQYSNTTMQYAGVAIKDSLSKVKQDARLYVNLSNIADESQLKGKLATFMDGQTYTDMSGKSSEALKSDVRMAITDVSTGGGYRLNCNDFKKDGDNIIARFKLTNGYTRHLAMYVRYLYPSNKPIERDTIGEDFFSKYNSYFPLSGPNYKYDNILRVVECNSVFMGIPVSDKKEEFSIPIPPSAGKIQIIGNTLGIGDDHYKHIGVGSTLTAVFDLAIPALFLAGGAASSYKIFAKAKTQVMIIEGIKIFISIHEKLIRALTYKNYEVLLGIAIDIGKTILGAVSSKYLLPALLSALGVGNITNVIPIIGTIISAVTALATAATMTQTIAQIFNSPWNYVKTLTFVHDIRVKINHDPKNPEGFPSVATYYVVTTVCQSLDDKKNVIDSATPIQVTKPMQATTRTDPIELTVQNVPYGGSISLAVGFYSATGWLAGYAIIDKADNTKDFFEFTITQNQVPLTSKTYYSHKEKTALDSAGRHIWIPTTKAPTPTPIGRCGQTTGELCDIISITDSNTFASVGYSWKAYGNVNQSCSGAGGQMYFFANMSTTQSPEDSYVRSCGQMLPTRLVYDLMGDSQRNFYIDTYSGNIIRQVRLSLRGKPDFDGPNSNRAWGRLNFSSDSLLLHPNGKIVSINATVNKIEVLTLPPEPTTDREASLAAVYGGEGRREGLLGGPLCAALTPKGQILILETANDRIQAFDTGGNPMRIFKGGSSYFATLKYSARQYQYIDMATEYTGYIYLLCYQLQQVPYSFYLDIYTPDGEFLSRTQNFSGMKIAVSYWRDVFAANMEAIKKADDSMPDFTEPTISRWIPSTP